MELTYVGPDPAVVGIVPCPEGWPAANHDEANGELAAEKLASGLYLETKPVKKPVDPAGGGN
jgi:hypothetical protein